jgi:hypothetical protein
MKIYLLNSVLGNQRIRNSPIKIPGTIPEIHLRNNAKYPTKFLLLKRYLFSIQIKMPALIEEIYNAEIDEKVLTRNW